MGSCSDTDIDPKLKYRTASVFTSSSYDTDVKSSFQQLR